MPGDILKPRILDLFAGAGGFSLGMHAAGLNTAVAMDRNPKAIETLKANFGDEGTVVLNRDLTKFTPKDLRRELAKQGIDPQFEMIIGGPPCQGWSSVGRGKLRSLHDPKRERQFMNDPRNKLYKRYLEFVDHFKPQVCVMENVSGMLSHNGQNVAVTIAQQLHDLGYRVNWTLLNASDYGVPQSRKRLIFVGVRNDLKITFEFPKVLGPKNERRFPLVTLKEAIADLPIIRNGTSEWHRPYGKPRFSSAFIKEMRKDADPSRIYDHVCRNQNDQDLEAFRILRPGGKYVDLPKRFKRYRDDIFKDKYRKLRWDRVSGCVTAHLGKDCYTHIHPSQARTISVREAARIQSFPDRFFFSGSMGDKFMLIGNAVPPILAKALGKEIKKQVFGKRKATKKSEVFYAAPIFTNLSSQELNAA